MERLKIGELSGRTGCSAETIRYYEREGMLPMPPRSEGNYRLYSAAHVERLRFIRHCRSLDMSLAEIRTLLQFRDAPEADCGGVNQLLDNHIGHVAARIAELQELQSQLEELRRQCDSTSAARNCRILQNLAAGSGAEPTHLGSHHGRNRQED